MNLFGIFKKKEKEDRNYLPFGLNSLIYNTNYSYRTDKSMLLSTVYRCVDVIGDTIAKKKIKKYKKEENSYKRK